MKNLKIKDHLIALGRPSEAIKVRQVRAPWEREKGSKRTDIPADHEYRDILAAMDAEVAKGEGSKRLLYAIDIHLDIAVCFDGFREVELYGFDLGKVRKSLYCGIEVDHLRWVYVRDGKVRYETWMNEAVMI